ncbi:MAG: YgjV family protein [Ruminococcaceae bacterium]|nr:YgjV family protein [Oscillospiraceae bacterium]
MTYILSQIFGIVSSAAAILSLQTKSIKLVLIFQLLCNSSGAVSYILTGGLSGCGIYVIAILQSLIYSIYRIKEKKAPKALAAVFISAYIICSVLTFRAPIDILSAAAAMTCAFALIQERSSVYRLFILANGTIWLFYDLTLGAYTMMFSHVATVISATVGIIRFDIKKKK